MYQKFTKAYLRTHTATRLDFVPLVEYHNDGQ